MEVQIRSADKRGKLSRDRQSRVQRLAAEYMLVIADHERAEQQWFDMRLALISHPNLDPMDAIAKLFPAWGEEPAVDPVTDSLENTEGEWQFVEDVDPEEVMRRQQEIFEAAFGNKSGSITLPELAQRHNGDGNPWV